MQHRQNLADSIPLDSIKGILEAAKEGKRISDPDCLTLLNSPDWYSITKAAHQKRLQLHSPEIVSYTAFRVVNYTNVCTVECTFCSFMEEVGNGRGYTLSLEEIGKKTEEAIAQGADQIFFQGGVNPDLPLEYYLDALQFLKTKYNVHIRAFSPVELLRLSEKLSMPLNELLKKFKEVGLDSVPGAGAEILTDRMRQVLSPKKLSSAEWCTVMGECHKAGLPGSCNIVIGSTETQEDVVEHLSAIRQQQDKTGGFLSFVPWTFQPQTKRFTVRHVKPQEYLKLLAISRLYFDNIPNIEVSILGLGREIGELALHSGANDINSIVIEENVLRSSGLKTLRAAERFILEAGFKPSRRNLNYDFSPYSLANTSILENLGH